MKNKKKIKHSFSGKLMYYVSNTIYKIFYNKNIAYIEQG